MRLQCHNACKVSGLVLGVDVRVFHQHILGQADYVTEVLVI